MSEDDWNEQFSVLIEQAQNGDQRAIETLWNHYYSKLKAAVRQRVKSIPVLMSDSSDLASTALHGFFHRALIDKEFDLRSPNAVWKLIQLITTRHVNDQLKRLKAQKRCGKVPAGAEDFESNLEINSQSHSYGRRVEESQVIDSNGTSAEAEFDYLELLDRLLESVDDKRAGQVILLRLENRSNAEIAEMLGLSLRTVQRILKQLTTTWENLSKDAK
jgi:RNA polymerase sigma factor (sigma-70 family)